jgi:hypothetical protein
MYQEVGEISLKMVLWILTLMKAPVAGVVCQVLGEVCLSKACSHPHHSCHGGVQDSERSSGFSPEAHRRATSVKAKAGMTLPISDPPT